MIKFNKDIIQCVDFKAMSTKVSDILFNRNSIKNRYDITMECFRPYCFRKEGIKYDVIITPVELKDNVSNDLVIWLTIVDNTNGAPQSIKAYSFSKNNTMEDLALFIEAIVDDRFNKLKETK